MPFNPCRNPKCDYFNKSLPGNAKVCPMCGEPLGSVFPAPDPPPVAPPPQYSQPPVPQPAPPVYPQTPAPQPSYAVPQPVPTWESAPSVRPMLRLIHATGREFQLTGDNGYIGRTTPSNPRTPEIDLAGIPDEGVVSRTHAHIYWDAAQNAYMIVDNRSRNGTFLNNAILRPEVPYRLVQGMALQLGQEGLVRFTIALT